MFRYILMCLVITLLSVFVNNSIESNYQPYSPPSVNLDPFHNACLGPRPLGESRM